MLHRERQNALPLTPGREEVECNGTTDFIDGQRPCLGSDSLRRLWIYLYADRHERHQNKTQIRR